MTVAELLSISNSNLDAGNFSMGDGEHRTFDRLRSPRSEKEVAVASDDVFDVIVIGARPVGGTTARRAVLGGLSAAVAC